MYGPEANSEFCFPESLDDVSSRDYAKGKIRTRVKTKLTRGPYIKCYGIYLGFALNNHIAITKKNNFRRQNVFIYNRQSCWISKS